MYRSIDITRETDALQVLNLQRAAYRIEAGLLERDDLPPLHETLSELRTSGETFLGHFEGETLAGAVAYRRRGWVVDLHRVMVHPTWFRRGIAQGLIQAVEAREPGWATMLVSTGSLNTPALRLYERLGFGVVREREVVPGLRVTLFEKHRT